MVYPPHSLDDADLPDLRWMPGWLLAAMAPLAFAALVVLALVLGAAVLLAAAFLVGTVVGLITVFIGTFGPVGIVVLLAVGPAMTLARHTFGGSNDDDSRSSTHHEL